MRTIIILLMLMGCLGQLHAQYIYKIKADSVLITNDSCTAELNLENSTKNIKGFLYNKDNGRTEFRKGAIKLNDTSYVIGGDTITVGGSSGNFIINQYAAPQPATYWINSQARIDNRLIISVPDTNATNDPYSYAHAPLFQALRLGTNDAPAPSINNNALISFGRHYGAGIMLYDNLNTTIDCYGVGITPFAIQNYVPGLGGGAPTYFTWNIGGYQPITGANEIMRLKNNGNLMIGTSTDNGSKLQVNGTTFSNFFTNSPTALGRASDGAIRLRWGGAEGSYIDFYNQGNDNLRGRIASPADSRPLNIYDNIGFSFFTPFVAVGSEYGTGSNTKLSVLNPQGATMDAFKLARVDAANANVYDYDLSVKASGNVLIGSDADNGNKLQVTGTANITGSVNGPGGGPNSYGQSLLVSPALKAQSDYEYLSAVRISPTFNNNGHSPYDFAFLVTNGDSQFANGLLFDIGDPYFSRIFSGQTIQIQSNAQTGPQISMNNWIGGAFKGSSVVEMGTGSSALDPSQNILTVYGNNGYVGTFFKSDGKLGIGTNAPTVQLHTTGKVRFAGLAADSSQTRVVVSDANGNLYYRNLNAWAYGGAINADLAVNGELSAQKIKVKPATWADYVFDKDYRLPSLQEVEQYIRQHKHLAGIPAAAEVQKEGIDVAGNQAALLKKIEELTLYMVEQQKQLQQQNLALKKQNEAITLLKQEVKLLKKGKRNNH